MEFRNQAGVSPGMVAAVAWSCVMSRFVLGALALIGAGWTMSAQAADFNYGRTYTSNQRFDSFSWAGPYLGGNLGYAWGSVANNPTKPSGIAGGIQAGYNWRFYLYDCHYTLRCRICISIPHYHCHYLLLIV